MVFAPLAVLPGLLPRLPAEPTPDPSATPAPDSSDTPEPSDSASVLVDKAAKTVKETTETVTETTVDLFTVAWHAAIGVGVGMMIAFVILTVLRGLGRRRTFYEQVVSFCRTPLYVLGGLSGAYVGAQTAFLDLSRPGWSYMSLQALLITVILAVTWLTTRFLGAMEATVVHTVQGGGDEGRARRVTTQAQILRRVTAFVVIICGLVGAIMTFPAARFAMGSLLASAGLISVVAGLAAQSTLKNVFAGLQIASTDAIRVDDVVDVDDNHGRIEEITLTYVVVRIWDERRVILPSTYFTENPFINWTRRTHEMLGVVTFEVDWRLPVALMRAELARILAASSAWDGRKSDLVITSTSTSTITARVTVSALNPDDLWTLQCHVREEMISWMQREVPYALPRTRVEVETVEVSHNPEPEQVAHLAAQMVAERERASAESDDEAAAGAPGQESEAEPEAEQTAGAGKVLGRLPLRGLRRRRWRRP